MKHSIFSVAILHLLASALFILSGCYHTIDAGSFADIPVGESYTLQGDYKIGPGDRIVVSVLEEKGLSGEYVVSATGILPFPLIGFVDANGVTSNHLAQRIKGALKYYVKNPTVAVSVAGIGNLRVYFSGQFKKIGEFPLISETTLLKGIILAGGLTDYATERIVIFRKTKDGVLRRFAVNYDAILNGKNYLDSFKLENGDIIHAE
jgi:polysaccharide export outer membrane protein